MNFELHFRVCVLDGFWLVAAKGDFLAVPVIVESLVGLPLRKSGCTARDTVYNTIMKTIKIVLDTNVLVSALRSSRGASYRLLQMIDDPRLELHLSVPIFLEYEDAAKRLVADGALREQDIDDILNYLLAVACTEKIHYLWRPLLRDPQDDMVLEVAVAGSVEAIVTYNKRDFDGVETFGLRLLTPLELLQEMGELPS